MASVEILESSPNISFKYMLDTSKNQALQDIEYRMSKADSFGQYIDQNIMSTVVAMNAMGIHTTSSCEGHLNWGCPSPWIRIGALGVGELEKELRDKMQRYQESPNEETANAYHNAEKRLKPLHAKEEEKLVKQLNAFYHQHNFDYDRHLVIDHVISGECLLQSHGAAMQEFRDDDEKALKLQEYQKEMQDFARFLKQEFFKC